MTKTFNLTNEQKERLTRLSKFAESWDMLEYFKIIRPKEYIRLLNRVAKKYGVDSYGNDIDWDGALFYECMDDIILDMKNEILKRCGII